jgi:hypothetical protein
MIKLSADAIAILREVIKLVEEEPRKLDMNRWAVQIPEYKRNDTAPVCGTIGCIAGWTVMLHITEQQKMEALKESETRSFQVALEDIVNAYSIEEAARDILNIDSYASDQLFYVENWPEAYANMYKEATTPEQKADTVKQYIELLIESNE